MSENYLTFEQAKDLKVLGFPQEFSMGEAFYVDERVDLHGLRGDILEAIKEIPDVKIKRPTFSQVQDWLRKEKGIHVCLDYVFSGTYNLRIIVPDSDVYVDTDGPYEYEEAISLGVDKAIKILKENGKLSVGEDKLSLDLSPWISIHNGLPGMDDEVFVSFISSDGKRYYACWKGYLLLDDIRKNDNIVDYWMPVPKI